MHNLNTLPAILDDRGIPPTSLQASALSTNRTSHVPLLVARRQFSNVLIDDFINFRIIHIVV
jgi:hypothetical protein